MHFVDSHFTVCENIPRQPHMQDEKDGELIHWPVYAWYIIMGWVFVRVFSLTRTIRVVGSAGNNCVMTSAGSQIRPVTRHFSAEVICLEI